MPPSLRGIRCTVAFLSIGFMTLFKLTTLTSLINCIGSVEGSSEHLRRIHDSFINPGRERLLTHLLVLPEGNNYFPALGL